MGSLLSPEPEDFLPPEQKKKLLEPPPPPPPPPPEPEPVKKKKFQCCKIFKKKKKKEKKPPAEPTTSTSTPSPSSTPVSSPSPSVSVSVSKPGAPVATPIDKKPKLCCSARLLLSLAGFVNFFNIAYVRIAISIAFICMVKPHHLHDDEDSRQQGKSREFNWSSATKGWLTSAVFYGFIFGPIVGGFLSFKYGGKLVMIIGVTVTGVGYLLLPEGARLSPALFFAIRVVTGFFCGFNFPAYFDLVAHWIVPEETQLLVSGALVGIPAASIFIFPLSALICKSLGWVWLFYLMGVWLLCCGFVFYFIIYNYPDSCPFVSKEEREFIETRLPKHRSLKIPWKAMLKSMPIYAYIVIHFCVSYVYLSIVLSLPMFMEEVHHFPLKANGLLSAIPFVGSILVRICLSFFFEPIRMKLKISKNTLRKTLTFFGSILVSTFLIITTRIPNTYRYYALASLILAVTSFELCVTGGYLLSLLDLCPSYVNILTGITNTIANTAGLIGPVVNGLITAEQTIHAWNIVFYVNVTLLLFSMVFYLIFGRNDLLPWGRARDGVDDPTVRVSIAATN